MCGRLAIYIYIYISFTSFVSNNNRNMLFIQINIYKNSVLHVVVLLNKMSDELKRKQAFALIMLSYVSTTNLLLMEGNERKNPEDMGERLATGERKIGCIQ